MCLTNYHFKHKGTINNFQKQNLRKFVSRIHALPKIVNGVLFAEMKGHWTAIQSHIDNKNLQ